MTTRLRDVRTLGLALVVLAAAPSPLAAQPVQSARADTPAPVGAAGDSYLYDPQGRRDPFVSLVGRGIEKPETSGPRGAVIHSG